MIENGGVDVEPVSMITPGLPALFATVIYPGNQVRTRGGVGASLVVVAMVLSSSHESQ